MRLVTFGTADGRIAAGALVEGDSRLVDLQAACADHWGDPSPMLASVLAMAESGAAALSLASDAIATALLAGTNLIGRDGVRLGAPIPRPPQMRDFLCFEKHLVQAFRQGRIVRSRQFPDPAKNRLRSHPMGRPSLSSAGPNALGSLADQGDRDTCRTDGRLGSASGCQGDAAVRALIGSGGCASPRRAGASARRRRAG